MAINEEIPSLGSVPQTTDPANFDSRADALLGTALPAFRDAVNVWAGEANSTAATINADKIAAADSASASSTSADESAASADESAASANAADAASNATLWVSGESYVSGNVTYSPIDFKSYRANTSTSGTTDPSLSVDWTPLAPEAAALLPKLSRTSNTILTAGDTGSLIDITSGTFAQTFEAAATLLDGWFVYITNSGDGDITLEPDGSELIDGLSSFVMYPNETRIIQCDGSALTSVVLNPFRKIFTASGTFVKPSGYKNFSGILWGAGGSGGRGGQYGASCGGGGGAAHAFSLDASDFSATETVTIGAGGAAINTTYTSGITGGNSTLGALVTSYGGGGGFGTNTFSGISGGSGGGVNGAGLVGNGGTRQGGQPQESESNLGGAPSYASSEGRYSVFGGASGGGASASLGLVGGDAEYGGAGGGGTSTGGTNKAGGVSLQGGNGGDGERSISATDGEQPAGGGGGSGGWTTAFYSGAGGDGQLTITGGL